MRKVVVTGIGALSPTGNTFKQSWGALKAGTSGILPLTRFDASGLRWKTAGELKGFTPGEYLSVKEINRLDAFVQYAAAAAIMAAEDAGLTEKGVFSIPHYALNSAGVIIGSSRGGICTLEKALMKRADAAGGQTKKLRLSPYIMPATTISMAASYTAQKLGMGGYCLGISNACASGTNAIGEAFRLIRSGYLDFALTGGTEAPICRLCVEGYGISGVLSETIPAHGQNAPMPFDRKRNGFVLSEGACMLVLEERENAVMRGAAIYGEITGYGNTTDAFHITRPDPAGEAKAMLLAISEAGLTPDDIDYINTHGTATRMGDFSEAEAIKTVFGKRASEVPATAVKSQTGHLLAASGALEAAFTLMSLKENFIPPTINISEKDPACAINIVTEKMTRNINAAISNSFGFGGVNAVLALKKN